MAEGLSGSFIAGYSAPVMVATSSAVPSVAALLAIAAVHDLVCSQSSPPNRPWPPGVQKVSADSPALSPEDALKTFYMPPGYRLELVASEPLIQEPVAFDWDYRGTIVGRRNAGLHGRHHAARTSTIQLDAWSCSRTPTATAGWTSARSLPTVSCSARSLKVLDRGVLVAEPPNVWLMRDTNGDLRMDTKELSPTSTGRFDGDPQNNANGFYWGLDNRMYTAGQSDIQLRLKDGVFEVQKTLQRGEWGVSQDDARKDVPEHQRIGAACRPRADIYYARNPTCCARAAATSGLPTTTRISTPSGRCARTPGTNRAYQIGIDREDGSLAKFTSVCAPAGVSRRPVAGRALRQRVRRRTGRQSRQPHRPRRRRNGIAREEGVRTAANSSHRPTNASARSTVERARRDAVYRGHVSRDHRAPDLGNRIPSGPDRRAQAGSTDRLGRIYRVVHETTTRESMNPFAHASSAQLVEALSDANGWRRDTAQRLLVERGPRGVVPDLVKLASGAVDWRTRLHALWTLDGLDAIQPETVAAALQDRSRDVRVSAIRLAERWLADAGHPLQAAVLKLIDDPDWAVHQQLAASIGMLPPGARERAAVACSNATATIRSSWTRR